MAIRGIREVEARMEAALREIVDASHESIREVAFDLLGRAIELAPIDTSDLRGSGKVTFQEIGQKLVADVSFNTPYAVIQHETLWYNHPNGGQAKYLEQPFQQNAERYIQHIRDSVRRVT